MDIIIVLIGIILLLLLVEIYWETHTFRVVNYSIKSPKFETTGTEENIVILSDLHNKIYGKNNEKLICEIKKQSPTIILIAGDMLVGKKKCSYKVAEELMYQLVKVCPVFYVNGNHEQRMKERPNIYGDAYVKYKKAITAKGVTMLENKSCFRSLGNELVEITGLEIPLEYYKKNCRKKLSKKEVEEQIGKADTGCFQILVAHNPAHMIAYKNWGADLIVSGHYHGGIIRIPFIGGFISPQAKIFPKYSGGIYKEGDTTCIVSKGLGVHTIRIRLCNRAELIVLKIGNNKEKT